MVSRVGAVEVNVGKIDRFWLDNVVDLRIIGETMSFKTILLSRVLTEGSRNVWVSESINKDRSIVSLLNLLSKPLKHSFPGLTDSWSRIEEEVFGGSS